MPEKLLSIITINYQNLAGLRATLASVMQQESVKDWEWIIIDGGSKDGSLELIQEYQTHVEYWVSEPDKGIYDAMNKGLKQAQGRFVWFLNSGDRMHGPLALKSVVEAIKAYPEVDCFYSDTYFVDDTYKQLGLISKLKPQKYPDKLTFESFRYGMNVCHQSFVVRRELSPYYKTEYQQAADIDWVLEILAKRPNCMPLNYVLSEFLVGGSSTENWRKAMKERYTILRRHFGFLPNLWAHTWIFIRRFFFRGNS